MNQKITFDNLSIFLNIMDDIITSEFNFLKHYIEEQERQFKRNLIAFEKMIDKQTSGLTQEELYDFWNSYGGERETIEDEFPSICRSTCFIICYSYLEKHLLNICQHFERYYKLKMKDLKGKGIFLAQNYFNNVVNINFPDNSDHWQKIRVYNQIRNSIVHNLGEIIPGKKDEVNEFINNNPTLAKLGYKHRISFIKSFMFDVLETIDSFFNELLQSLALWRGNYDFCLLP